MRNKKYSLKQLLIVCIIACLLSSSCVYYIYARTRIYSTSFSGRNIYLDDIPTSTSYKIDNDGTNVWATRYDGKIVSSGNFASASSTVIQAAIDDMPSRGGEIYFMPGEYMLTKKFASPVATALYVNDKKVTLRGAGYSGVSELSFSARLKLANDQNCGILYVYSSHTAGCNIFDLEFDGNRDNQAEAHPLVHMDAGSRVKDSYIANSMFRKSKGRTLDLRKATDTWIYNNAFEDSASGVYIECNYMVRVFNNYIYSNDASDLDYGFYFASGENNFAVGNIIWRNVCWGMFVDSMKTSTISDNIFKDNRRIGSGNYSGLYLGGTSTYLNVKDNLFVKQYYYHTYDIRIGANTDYLFIKNNVCKGYVTAAIFTETGGNPNGVASGNDS